MIWPARTTTSRHSSPKLQESRARTSLVGVISLLRAKRMRFSISMVSTYPTVCHNANGHRKTAGGARLSGSRPGSKLGVSPHTHDVTPCYSVSHGLMSLTSQVTRGNGLYLLSCLGRPERIPRSASGHQVRRRARCTAAHGRRCLRGPRRVERLPTAVTC